VTSFASSKKTLTDSSIPFIPNLKQAGDRLLFSYLPLTTPPLMTLSNPWFLAALIGVLGVFHLELMVTLLNLARLGRPYTGDLAEIYPEKTREKLQEYITDGKKVDFSKDAAFLVALILFWWGGGFGWLQGWAASCGFGPVETGVMVIALVMLSQMLIGLPFEIWDTFGIETKHGFNRTTPSTFLQDQLKGLLLMAVIGLPVAWVVVWFFQTQAQAALYAWLFLAGFTVLMSFLAPRFLMPLFHEFKPLEAGELRDAILALSVKLDFPVQEVSVVDGSKRSSKANAFFAGFGKTRRIALYDTLISGHTTEEILAVLAHEIGHNKRRHVPIGMAVGLLEMGLMLFLLSWVLGSPDFFSAFGVAGRPVGMGLVLFGILYQPLGIIIGLLGLALSRKHEFEADAFAATAVGSALPLMEGLKRLSRDHLAHPQPHPWAVFLHYSHPPLIQRLAALRKL
jgi:STE24 endopeptidase